MFVRISNGSLSPETGRLDSVSLEPHKDGYLVHITLYDYGTIGNNQVAYYEELINAKVEHPITLLATVLSGKLTGSEGDLSIPVLSP